MSCHAFPVLVFSIASLFVAIHSASAQVCFGGCDDGNPCTIDECVSSGTVTGGGGVGRCVSRAGNAGAVCRPAAGPCDIAETCNGTSTACPTPDRFLSSRTVCRASTGFCDPAESCTGSSASCPSDTHYGPTIICRPLAGPCDVAERCTGLSGSCPSDALRSAGATCRGVRDLCDVAETCTGSSASCPADGFSAAGTPCRAARGDCDLPEVCTGSSRSCPADGRKPAGASCTDDGNVCTNDACDGSSNTCRHLNNTNSCSDRNACTTGDVCSGGSCRGGRTISCDDRNSCTTDSCNPATGCRNTPMTSCVNGDGCCPTSCNVGNDNDCPARCGDGVVSAGEECDDGNMVDTDGCRNNCHLPQCGDGVVESGEECDDGNTTDGDGCNHECRLPCQYTTPLTCPAYWTHVIPADGGSKGRDITLDTDGNVYVVGTILNYDSSISPASQGENIYLTKYDKCGNFRWSHVINSSYNPWGEDGGYGVATDTDRNVYLTGNVSQAAVCLPFAICPYDNILIRKYDTCGGELWSRYYEGAFDDRGLDIALDGLGNVYVVGGADADLISSPHRFFVGKYSSSDGTPAGAPWPLSFVGAGGNAWAHGVATDAGGDIFVVGTTTTTRSLTTGDDPDSGGDPRSDIRLLKFRPDSTLDPAFGVGRAVIYDGGGGDVGNGIALDSTGNVYVAGGQGGDPSSLWIGKFDSIGTLVGDPFPLTYSTYGEGDSVAVDGEGNLYVAGRANGRGIVLKYNTSGSVVWAHNSATTDSGNFYEGITVDSDGSVYVTGRGVRAGIYGIWIRKYAPDGTSDDGPADTVGP